MGKVNVPHLPWWESKGNHSNKAIESDYLEWDSRQLTSKPKRDAPRKANILNATMGYWYFNRSFVLEKIRRVVIKPLQGVLTNEEILDLVKEAMDFDLEEYKREFYQAHPNDSSGD